jgi:hypothetical protein
MKTKKITIKVRALDDALKEAGEVFDKLQKGQHWVRHKRLQTNIIILWIYLRVSLIYSFLGSG